jgi:hypothetical protein
VIQRTINVRGGDDNFSVDELLVELGVGVILVGGCDEGVAGILEPFADSKLVLGCALRGLE